MIMYKDSYETWGDFYAELVANFPDPIKAVYYIEALGCFEQAVEELSKQRRVQLIRKVEPSRFAITIIIGNVSFYVYKDSNSDEFKFTNRGKTVIYNGEATKADAVKGIKNSYLITHYQ